MSISRGRSSVDVFRAVGSGTSRGRNRGLRRRLSTSKCSAHARERRYLTFLVRSIWLPCLMALTMASSTARRMPKISCSLYRWALSRVRSRRGHGGPRPGRWRLEMAGKPRCWGQSFAVGIASWHHPELTSWRPGRGRRRSPSAALRKKDVLRMLEGRLVLPSGC